MLSRPDCGDSDKCCAHGMYLIRDSTDHSAICRRSGKRPWPALVATAPRWLYAAGWCCRIRRTSSAWRRVQYVGDCFACALACATGERCCREAGISPIAASPKRPAKRSRQFRHARAHRGSPIAARRPDKNSSRCAGSHQCEASGTNSEVIARSSSTAARALSSCPVKA